MKRPAARLVLSLFTAAAAPAQNRDHPGLVPIGEGQWGTPAHARERGLSEYRGRWLPKKLEKELRRWEREDEKGLDWKDAYRTKSKYYRIQTNVPRYLIELEIKPFLDELFATYARVFERDFGIEGKAAGNKDIRIYSGFEAYSQNEGGRPRSNPGFYVDGSMLVMYYDDTDPSVFYMTVFHEGAHQFLRSLLPASEPPIWLTEALAAYFEGCTYSRASGKITPGFIPAERLDVARSLLRGDPSASPEDLFLNVPKERFRGREYALAWSFVYYLIHRPVKDAHERFARFVRELNGSGVKPAAEVFEQTTGERLADVQAGWREYVLALQAPGEITWVVLDVAQTGPGEDLRTDDLLWSFDGVEVFGARQLHELWSARAKDRALDVIVVRCEPSRDAPDAPRRFVRATIAPGSAIELRAKGELARRGGLAD